MCAERRARRHRRGRSDHSGRGHPAVERQASERRQDRPVIGPRVTECNCSCRRRRRVVVPPSCCTDIIIVILSISLCL